MKPKSESTAASLTVIGVNIGKALLVDNAECGRLLTACFESHEAGSRLRLGWARRWSMRRIAARVTIASETSGSAS